MTNEDLPPEFRENIQDLPVEQVPAEIPLDEDPPPPPAVQPEIKQVEPFLRRN